MTVREGSLDAPTRHPLDWRNPGFYDEQKLDAALERVFDICHGCRRCVNLCTAFPTLFDLVDESKTMQVDGVAEGDFWKVVDQCYLCDMCYMTKCPYVPPHPRMLEMVPGIELTTVERCAGHDGTWGVKREYFDNSMKIGRPVFRSPRATSCKAWARTRAGRRKPTLSRCCGRLTASRLFLAALLAGCVQLTPLPGKPFAFGVLGDTPYSAAEAHELEGLIGRINAQDLAFVVHVGDIGTSARTQGCSDAWLEARRAQFARISHPFILLPGDNEWTDCAKHGMDPQARLARWRELFCTDVAGLALERQPGHCENARWDAGGMAFIGLNVPGGGDPDLADARMAATLEWLDESLAWAESRRARTNFVFMHADPRFERVGATDAYARLRAVLRTHAAWHADRLVLVHGDLHTYRDDRPLPGLRRIEVWGAPIVSWLRIDAGGAFPRVHADW